MWLGPWIHNLTLFVNQSAVIDFLDRISYVISLTLLPSSWVKTITTKLGFRRNRHHVSCSWSHRGSFDDTHPLCFCLFLWLFKVILTQWQSQEQKKSNVHLIQQNGVWSLRYCSWCSSPRYSLFNTGSLQGRLQIFAVILVRI